MTNNCCGLFGRIFGQAFKAFAMRTETTPPNAATFKLEGENLAGILDALTARSSTFIVRCRRCGISAQSEGTQARP